MKAIVTGGAGFIGSHIVDNLITRGHQVTIIDNLSSGNVGNINPRAKFFFEDITDRQVIDIFTREEPEFVFHLAGQSNVQSSLKDPYLDAKVNILGTINILEACVRSGVKKIIYSSSAAAFGESESLGISEQHRINPISFYGISKHTPEHYFKVYNRQYGLGFTVLRYANVYGPRQDPKGEGGVVSIFIDKILSGQAPTIFGDGNQTRDFIYVQDVAAANFAALKNGNGRFLNIGTGKQSSVNDLFKAITTISRMEANPEYGPERPGDIRHSYLINTKGKAILKWSPQYSLDMGLRETIEYYFSIKPNLNPISESGNGAN